MSAPPAESLPIDVSMTDEVLDRLYQLSDAVGETIQTFAADRARSRVSEGEAVSVSGGDVGEVERLLAAALHDLAEREGFPAPGLLPHPSATPDAARHVRHAAA